MPSTVAVLRPLRLHKRQRALLVAAWLHRREKGYWARYEELRDATGLASINTVWLHARMLRAKGVLLGGCDQSRTFRPNMERVAFVRDGEDWEAWEIVRVER